MIRAFVTRKFAARGEMTVTPERLMEGIYHGVEQFAQQTGRILFAIELLIGQGLGFYKHLN